MDSAQFIERLVQCAAASRIALSPEQADRCLQHVSLMLQWNRRLNLTRITALQEILTKHLLDSLLPARWLPRSGYALDVGSGAGFPGTPLAIYRPELQMVLLEAVRKKASFLKVVAAGLGLDNLGVRRGRWQELVLAAPHEDLPRCTLITMRAVRFDLEHLTRLAAALLTPGGVFAWWAGPGSTDLPLPTAAELEGSSMSFAGAHQYTLPGPGSEARHILLWQKSGAVSPSE